MNDLNDDTFITDTLHRGAADVQTPFDTITSGSITAGRRLKRRRTAGVVLGSAACVAALSAGVVGLTQLLPGNQAVDPGFGAGSSEGRSPTPTIDRATSSPDPGADHAPVRLDLAGWTCESPMDEKMFCTGPGDDGVTVQWRRVATYDDFVAKYPGERSSVGMLGGTGFLVSRAIVVSERGGRWFVDILPGEHTTDAILHDLARALAWK